jgi:quercetin dioxygenase-like cupin family protein
MINEFQDEVEFEEIVTLALAEMASGAVPHPSVRRQLLARVAEIEPSPSGFAFRFATEDDWLPHPVPGIRMKVLAVNQESGYATLLLDVAPGTRFPAHHHDGDEECYVIAGSVLTLGRRLGPGDFLHADAGTDHGELWTDVGAQVLLVVPPEDYMPSATR